MVYSQRVGGMGFIPPARHQSDPDMICFNHDGSPFSPFYKAIRFWSGFIRMSSSGILRSGFDRISMSDSGNMIFKHSLRRYASLESIKDLFMITILFKIEFLPFPAFARQWDTTLRVLSGASCPMSLTQILFAKAYIFSFNLLISLFILLSWKDFFASFGKLKIATIAPPVREE